MDNTTTSILPKSCELCYQLATKELYGVDLCARCYLDRRCQMDSPFQRSYPMSPRRFPYWDDFAPYNPYPSWTYGPTCGKTTTLPLFGQAIC